MAGLGLMQAVQSYQQGRKWRQQQDDYAEALNHRMDVNAANRAAAKAFQDAQTAHATQQQADLDAYLKAGGVRDQFRAKPFDRERGYIDAISARSDALARSGRFDEWMRNEVPLAGLRHQQRQRVFADLLREHGDDPETLAKKAWPYIHDGTDLVEIAGAPQQNKAAINPAQIESASAMSGYGESSASANGVELAAKGPLYTGKLSNGASIGPLTGDQIKEQVLKASMDPKHLLEYEFKQRHAAAQRLYEQQKHERDVADRRDERQATLAGQIGLSTLNQDRADERAAKDQASRERIAKIVHGRTGGGSDGGKIHSTKVDSQGNIIVIDDRGNGRRLLIDDKPVKSADRTRAVSALVKAMQEGGDTRSMSAIRADASRQLDVDAEDASPTPESPAPVKPIDLEQFYR